MKIAVTGSSGFIGRSLCPALLNRGYAVRSAVRSLQSVSRDLDNTEKVAVGDISSDTDWQDTLRGIDVVIHLAALVHVMKAASEDRFAEYRQINTDGTARLALMAAEAGVKRFVFLSSIKVNGEATEVLGFSESDTPNPKDNYAISKWEAEQTLHKVAKDTGMEIVILRPPLVYGPHVRANFLRLLDMVNKNIPLPLSSINNKRSMIYIGNLIDVIVRCIKNPNAANQIFLLSDGHDVSTPDLIRMIAEAMGKKARLFPCPVSFLKMIGKITGKTAEVERLVSSLRIDNTKIRRELNWTPPFTMEHGIRMTANWFVLNEKNV